MDVVLPIMSGEQDGLTAKSTDEVATAFELIRFKDICSLSTGFSYRMVILWHIQLQLGIFNKLFCKLVNVGYKFQNLEQIIILLLLDLCRSTDIYISVGWDPCRIPHLIEYGRYHLVPHSHSLPSSTVCSQLCQPYLERLQDLKMAKVPG